VGHIEEYLKVHFEDELENFTEHARPAQQPHHTSTRNSCSQQSCRVLLAGVRSTELVGNISPATAEPSGVDFPSHRAVSSK
jgi:hypothetical protein